MRLLVCEAMAVERLLATLLPLLWALLLAPEAGAPVTCASAALMSDTSLASAELDGLAFACESRLASTDEASGRNCENAAGFAWAAEMYELIWSGDRFDVSISATAREPSRAEGSVSQRSSAPAFSVPGQHTAVHTHGARQASAAGR